MCVLLPAAQDPAHLRRLCTAETVILARVERTPECGTGLVYGPLGHAANPGVSRAAIPQDRGANDDGAAPVGSGAGVDRPQALPMFLSTFARTSSTLA